MSSRHHNGISGRPSSGRSSTSQRSTKSGALHSKDDSNSDHGGDDTPIEFKAAYIAVVKGSSTSKSLTSKAELLLALQNTGRNPTQRNLSKYWSRSTENLSYNEFCEICKKEPVTTEDDLMKAFKKIDINGDGFISHAELKKVMTTKGEKMTDDEVSQLIDEVDENKDGKLDYKEFCNMLLNTSNQCKDKAQKRLERKQNKSESKSSRERRLSTNDNSDSESKSDHKQRTKGDSKSSRENNSSTERSDSKRSIPRSPRISPRTQKGAKSKEETQKDKLGSQSSLRSHDSRNDSQVTLGNSPAKPQPRSRLSSLEMKDSITTLTDESPKPAPRRMSRQETTKAAISTLNLTLQPPKRLGDWRSIKRRGLFYLEEDGQISSTQYSLVITQSTSVWLTISPAPTQSTATATTPLDMCLLVMRNKPDKSGNSLLTFTEKRDNAGVFGVRCDLEPGKYTIMAFTSGCGLPVSKPSTGERKKLVKKKTSGSDQYALAKEFKYVLTDIFNMVDVDMNGLLSREEFSQYSMRTGEEEVGDDEWDVVKENAELKQGELTCKGFIQLVELEADDAGGDTDDLWVSLEAMGYDAALIQNQAYPFAMDVCFENDNDATVSALPSLLSSKAKPLQGALKEAYTSKGEPLSSENRCRSAKTSGTDKNVKIYVFETETMAAIIINNKLASRVSVKLDCTGSRNVKANNKSLSELFAIPANSSTVAFHLVPEDETKDWFVSCVEKDLQQAG